MDPTLADCVLVLVTIPDDADAAGFAEDLISAGVAACVSVLASMQSTYRWEGRIETQSERQVFIKTTNAGVPALWQRIRDVHPYEVPEFIVVPIIDGNEAYLKWVRMNVL